jgi:hypothetical protein
MGKVKNPTEKKRLTLARDRRNVYGENPAASRKGIAKASGANTRTSAGALRRPLLN